MATKTIYCSACDREVLIRLTPEGKLEGSVCMDIGENCTGTLCPICAERPEIIREKVKSRKDEASS
jgi:hypothetical protein